MTDMTRWSDAAIELIAQRFKLLSEPSRLRLLEALREGEKTVNELVTITHMTQANVSHQLQQLAEGGMILRRRAQQNVWYRLTDDSTLALQDLVCRGLRAQGERVVDSFTESTMAEAVAP